MNTPSPTINHTIPSTPQKNDLLPDDFADGLDLGLNLVRVDLNAVYFSAMNDYPYNTPNHGITNHNPKRPPKSRVKNISDRNIVPRRLF